MKVEFDITLANLVKLGWDQGDLIADSGRQWFIESIVKDSRMDVAWVTMVEVQG